MVTILVGPEVLRAKAEQLRISSYAVSRLLKNVDQQIRSLNPALFSGQRADQVRRRYESQRQQILAAPDLLLGFARALDNAAAVFEQADKNTACPNPVTIDTMPFLTEILTRIAQLPFIGRTELWDLIKQLGRNREFYNNIKWITPKHSTRVGSVLRIIKNIPAVEIVVGTVIDFLLSPEQDFDALMVALSKNSLESLVSPVMLVNLGVQLYGDLTTFRNDVAISLFVRDPAMQEQLRAINGQLDQAYESIDLENISHDLGSLIYHSVAGGIVTNAAQVGTAIDLIFAGSDTSRAFWSEPSIQGAYELFNQASLEAAMPYRNAVGQDLNALGSDLMNFVYGLPGIPEAYLKMGTSWAVARSATLVDTLPLPEAATDWYTNLSRNFIGEIAQIPTPMERTLGNLEVLDSASQTGNYPAMYNALIDLWQGVPNPSQGFYDPAFGHELAEAVENTLVGSTF